MIALASLPPWNASISVAPLELGTRIWRNGLSISIRSSIVRACAERIAQPSEGDHGAEPRGAPRPELGPGAADPGGRRAAQSGGAARQEEPESNG
jgi:hypothetical protein